MEVDSRRRGWMPSQTAMATAKDVIKLTDIMLHITRYRVVKAERKQRCSSSEWLRWIIQDEQKAQLQERQDSMSRKKERRWYEDVAQ